MSEELSHGLKLELGGGILDDLVGITQQVSIGPAGGGPSGGGHALNNLIASNMAASISH